jgi:hypothetical protein
MAEQNATTSSSENSIVLTLPKNTVDHLIRLLEREKQQVIEGARRQLAEIDAELADAGIQEEIDEQVEGILRISFGDNTDGGE